MGKKEWIITNDEPFEFYDCFGAIKNKLECNKLKFVNKEVSNMNDQIFMNQFKEFKTMQTEKYPKGHRFCAVTDRRKPENDKNEKEIMSGDELIMFEAPNNCNKIANDYHPMIFFETSRQCLIPQSNYNEGKNTESTISSLSHCNGAMLLLSFHIESNKTIKCYMYMNRKLKDYDFDKFVNKCTSNTTTNNNTKNSQNQ